MSLHPEGEKNISPLIEGERTSKVLPLPKGVLKVLRNAGLALSLALTAPHAPDLINYFLKPDNKDTTPISTLLKVRSVRGDSGAPYKISQDPGFTTAEIETIESLEPPLITSDYSSTDLEDQILRLLTNQPSIDTTPVKPMDCPYPSVDHDQGTGTFPEVDLGRVDIYGLVVGFSDQEEALNKVANSTYYHEGLRRQLDLATSYVNRFLNIRFSTEVLDGYFVYPKTYQEIREQGTRGLGIIALRVASERMPRQQYDKSKAIPYPIYFTMYVTNPDIPLEELKLAPGIGGGNGEFYGRIMVPWHIIHPDYTKRTDGIPQHELLHGVGIRHNPNNKKSIMYTPLVTPLSEAIVDKTDLTSLRCTFKVLTPISSR